MTNNAVPDAQNILRQPDTAGRSGRVRVMICGGIGDGKRTLIGRLLDSSKESSTNRVAARAADSTNLGSQGGACGFALPIDGRHVGGTSALTGDAASRNFATDKRQFTVCGTGTAEPCALDLINGSSGADVVVILVDARKGVLTQTRRQSLLVARAGIRTVTLAVNKLDLVGDAEATFGRIEAEYRAFAQRVGLHDITCIPLCALPGDNVAAPGVNLRWYRGPTLIGHLENVVVEDDARRTTLRAADNGPPAVADQFEATVVWMDERPMLPGRTYAFTIGPTTVAATVAMPKYKIDVDTLEHLAARTLHRDDIGVCNLHLDRPVVCDSFPQNRDAGGFVLSDGITGRAIGAGMLHFALRRSQNLHRQVIEVDRRAHAALKGHKPCVVWFTGLSGSGKSTIANLLEKKLHARGRHTYLLDGDNIRHGLSKDLGFTDADRVENIRRIAEVARLMADAGLIVLVAFISPFRAERRLARDLMQAGEFCEVFVDTPLGVAELRDAKGLYRKARSGSLKNFTGIDSPYEPPEAAEIRIDTMATAPDDATELIIAHLQRTGVFDPA